jgi:hypothetical protein
LKQATFAEKMRAEVDELSSLLKENLERVVQAVVVAFLLAFATQVSAADKKHGPGTSDTEIELGQASPLSDPASASSANGSVAIEDENSISELEVLFRTFDDAFLPSSKFTRDSRKLRPTTISAPLRPAIRSRPDRSGVGPNFREAASQPPLFLTVEPVVGQLIEPMVYGRSTGLSPVAVVASATFWTALWGPIGLVLATPLTICLVVLGRHVERLEFLDVMFGDRPALSPPEIFYQRMLAGDPTEAAEKAEQFLKERSLASYYDEVALKGLQLAQVDANRGALDQERLRKIRDAVSEFASDVSDQDDRPPTKVHLTTDAEASSAVESVAENAAHENLPIVSKEDLPPEWLGEHPVLCMAGRSLIDEAAAIMLAQLSTAHGLAARVEGADALSTTNVFRLETTGVAIVCLVYLDSSGPAHMRYSVRRLRRKLPKAIIILGCFKDIDPTALEVLRDNAKADLVAASLGEAVKLCIEATGVEDQSHAASKQETLTAAVA